MTTKKNRTSDPDAVIGLHNDKKWSASKTADIKNFLDRRIAQRSSKQNLELSMLRIQTQMEDYIENGKGEYSLDHFVKAFLGVLNISFKTFAQSIDTTDSNLKKYLTGERKFNSDLAMKFAHFFNMNAFIWLNVNHKNELLEFSKQKAKAKEYERYDYRKVLVTSK